MVTCSKTGMYYARGQWVQADGNAPQSWRLWALMKMR